MYRIIDFAHKVLQDHLKETDNAIDATCGNGFDTFFLAKHLQLGKVFAFDIQDSAIRITKALVEKGNLHNVYYFNTSHQNIPSIVSDPFEAVIFNLGYLPRGDKQVTTKAHTTMEGIDHLLDYSAINKNLLLVLVVYTGHPEGQIESEKILKKVEMLDNKVYLVTKFENYNRSNSPYVITIKRI